MLKTYLQHYRTVAFALTNMAVLALILATLVPVYAMIADRDEQIAARRETLQRLQSIVARESEIQNSKPKPGASAEPNEFLVGPNDGVVGADLQTRLKAMAERNSLHVRSMQSQPPRSVDPLRLIGAQLTVYGQLQHVRSMLYELEGVRPFLFIVGAMIKVSGSSVHPNGAEEPVIEARLDVFGALSPGGPGQ